MITLTTVTAVIGLIGAAGAAVSAWRWVFPKKHPPDTPGPAEDIDEVELFTIMRDRVNRAEELGRLHGVPPATALFVRDGVQHDVTWDGRGFSLDGLPLHGLLRPDHPTETLYVLGDAVAAVDRLLAHLRRQTAVPV